MKLLAISDIDGVIVDSSERFSFAQYLAKDEPDEKKRTNLFWKAFFYEEYLPLDTPIPGASEHLSRLIREGWSITLLTSRPEHLREATKTWLSTHLSCYEIQWGITMKPPSEQFKKTATWKAEQVHLLARLHGVEHLLVVDDEPKNAQAILDASLDVPYQVRVVSSLALATQEESA